MSGTIFRNVADWLFGERIGCLVSGLGDAGVRYKSKNKIIHYIDHRYERKSHQKLVKKKTMVNLYMR